MMIWKGTGSLSEGWFENDKRSGQGRLIGNDGGSYEGEFINDKINGHGNNIHSYIHSLQGSTSGQKATPTTGILKMITDMGEVSLHSK